MRILVRINVFKVVINNPKNRIGERMILYSFTEYFWHFLIFFSKIIAENINSIALSIGNSIYS